MSVFKVTVSVISLASACLAAYEFSIHHPGYAILQAVFTFCMPLSAWIGVRSGRRRARR